LYDETPPRSIFAATWFRAVLVLLVLGAVGAVAVPYILDAMNPPPKTASRTTPSSAAPPVAPPPAVTPAPVPSTPAPSTPPSAPDKTVMPDKPATAMPTTPRKPLPADKTTTPDKASVPDKALAPDKATAPDKPAMADKPVAPEKKDTRTAAADTKKPAPAAPKRAATTATTTAPKATGGEWWVQVGAFREADTAKKVAAKLRAENYKVEESVRGDAPAKAAASSDKSAPAASAAAPAGADQYDVFVSGMSAAELNKRLSAKGLAAEATGGGAVIKPSLPLRDAVALSKDLAVEGFKVQVRRAGGVAPEPAPRTASDRSVEPSAAAGGETLYRVRVGAFPDRATAMVTLKELEGKGFKPFIARGGQ
ncbi:MAG TPA: SPOR domain-containing protein, partial [Methylomirabilota bacterium]|nr:SPOR domain-containing protein [Methylomirabilota bacterium]